MRITLDIPGTVVAVGLTIMCDESTHFTLGAYNIGPDEIREGAIINIPRDSAEESPDSDLQGCWRVENVDDVRRADQVAQCEDRQFWQKDIHRSTETTASVNDSEPSQQGVMIFARSE